MGRFISAPSEGDRIRKKNIAILRCLRSCRRLKATYWGRDRLRRFFEVFERFLLLATFASIMLGVVAFWIDYSDRKVEARTRAWSLITTPATGNSGKGPALEYLNDHGIPLRGINLSCEHMGGWNKEKQTCKTRTYLRGVALQKADLEGAQLQGADLLNAQLQGAKLRGAQLQGANLLNAQLQGADLSEAQLQGADLSKAQLQGADLAGANLQEADLAGANLREAHLVGAKLQGAYLAGAKLQEAHLANAKLQGSKLWDAQFGGAHLSGADFTDTQFLNDADFHDPNTGLSAWAWADSPPIGLEEIEIELCFSNDHLALRGFERPDSCIPPDPAK